MSHKILTPFILALLISVINGAPPGEAPPPPKNAPAPSILSGIVDDEYMCPTVNPLLNSTYIKSCNEYSLPVTNSSTPEVFLCLTIYDRFYHICHARSFDSNLTILTNTKAFDAAISDKVEHSDVLLTCRALEDMLPPSYKKTTDYANKVIQMMKDDPAKCVTSCKHPKNSKKANPLCIALEVLDEQLKKEKPFLDDISAEKRKTVANAAPTATKPAQTVLPTQEVDGSVQNPLPDAQKSGNPSPEKPSSTGNQAKSSVPKVVHVDVADENDKAVVSKQETPENTRQPTKTPKVVQTTKTGDKEKETDKPEPAKTSAEKAGGTVDVTNSKDAETVNVQASVPPESGKAEDKDEGAMPKPPAKDVEVDEKEDLGSLKGLDDAYGGDVDGKEDLARAEDADQDDPLSHDSEKMEPKEPVNLENREQNVAVPRRTPDDDDVDGSHFFSYVTVFGLLGICVFIAYHHKHKIFAMLLEGRRSRGGRGRRRPSTANYRKLDCNLEEAVTSQCSSNVTHVIY